MQYFVDASYQGPQKGSRDCPFSTIQQAADIAMPGDEVLVAPGIYRENVDPRHAGTARDRITYRSIKPLAAVITGADPLTGWEPYQGTVWTTSVSNEIFGAYNPYTTLVRGDWFIATFIAHTGEVYLNDKAMYETQSLDGVLHPVRSQASWDPDFSVYPWYAEVSEDRTVFFANFQGADPNREHVDFNVRKNCFYPQQEGISYITLSGFTVTKAATQWAPPTAYQEGMIGPHWSKGWIIEDCDISHSKCSGISLGKYKQKNNDNKWLNWKFKDGTQTERDNICQASYEGWTKDKVGSHIIRRCNIHDCGQTGIVGHLGGVFSTIEDNHIHHINNRQNLAGAEIGGIKMHAAIDCLIRRNHIHNCTRGLWLDWQAQGTRVTQNLFHDNTLPFDFPLNEKGLTGIGEDIFVEVSHGPTLIDDNILLSERSLKLATQGVALVHNLIAGAICCIGKGVNNGARTLSSPRYTPYHAKHGTAVMGFMTILHGDTRIYNNIFVQLPFRKPIAALAARSSDLASEWDDMNFTAGDFTYDMCPTYQEWVSQFEGYCGMGSAPSDHYYIPLPVWTGGNAFFNGARPMAAEKDAYIDTQHTVTLSLTQKEDGGWYLNTDLYDYLPAGTGSLVDSDTLGCAFEPEQRFESANGSAICFDRDYFSNKRDDAGEEDKKPLRVAGYQMWDQTANEDPGRDPVSHMLPALPLCGADGADKVTAGPFADAEAARRQLDLTGLG